VIRNNQGFTLIELVTVMAVMGIVLFFTLPRFDAFNPFGASMTPTGKLLLLIEQLKSQTLETQQTYLLKIDTATGRVWATSPDLVPRTGGIPEKESPPEPLIFFVDGSSIEDVKIASRTMDNEGYGGEIIIRFSGNGYSDQAFIYIQENDRGLTVVIEPFLPRAQLLNGHVSCGE
jgi:prepilin-type N-terminal cleavage/methylation domain-containing protein